MNLPKKITINLDFDEEQFEIIKMGLIPEEMEDKWFIYYEDGWLNFHRSWTGHMLYKALIVKEDDAYFIKEFFAERDTDIYKNKDDDYDCLALTFLIYQGLLKVETRPEFWKHQKPTEFGALSNWSMFGRMMFRGDD